MNYSVFSALLHLKLRVLSEEGILGTPVQKMLHHPYSYQSTIDKNPISLQRICVLSYLCLLLTKVLFETSFKSFQYNTEGRRLSNYSIKLILCSHNRSRCKGLCQNKNHEFDQYTKGGHFCAAHMALTRLSCIERGVWGSSPRKFLQKSVQNPAILDTPLPLLLRPFN